MSGGIQDERPYDMENIKNNMERGMFPILM